MKKRTILTIFAAFVILITLGVTQGLAHMRQSFLANGVPCGIQPGIVGVLQKMEYLPAGSCATNSNSGGQGKGGSTKCLTDGSDCTFKNPVSGHQSNGLCQAQGNTCVCNVDAI